MSIPKKDLEKNIEDECGKIKLKRGRFYIIYSEAEGGHHALWHQCEKASPQMGYVYYETLSDYDFRPIIPGWRCDCGAKPPESIIGVWCLLEPDATSEEVQEELSRGDQFEEELESLGGWGLDSSSVWDVLEGI